MERFLNVEDKSRAELICKELKSNKEKKTWDSTYYGFNDVAADIKILSFDVERDRKTIKSHGYLTRKTVENLFSGEQLIFVYYSKHYFPIHIPKVHFTNEELDTLFPDKVSIAKIVREKISSIFSNSMTKKGKMEDIKKLHTGHYALIEKINNFYNKG